MTTSSQKNSLAELRPDIAAEWDHKENAPLIPQDVTVGSARKVWWVCDKGHHWEAIIASRTKKIGSGCPYCSRIRRDFSKPRRLIEGVTDLGTVRPDISAQWDYKKNNPLSPQDVTVSSHRKVWWTCNKGHHWEARINSRTRRNGTGCPYCAGKIPIPGETDLGTLRPDIAAEWDYEQNAPLTPQDVTVSSHRKVWWLCDKGHHWEAQTFSRTYKNGTGCPCCAGYLPIPGETDLSTLRPDIAAEWDYKRNAPLTPRDVTVSSNRKVWWVCSKGHHWETAVSDRTRRNGTGCPTCNRPGRKPLKPIRKEVQQCQ